MSSDRTPMSAIEELVRMRAALAEKERIYASLRERYTQVTMELAKLREGVTAALYPQQYELAQREGNFS